MNNTSKILVWQSYGDITLYDVTEQEKFKKVIIEILDCLGNWGIEDFIEKYRVETRKAPYYPDLVNIFDIIVDQIDPGSDTDGFEKLFITKLNTLWYNN